MVKGELGFVTPAQGKNTLFAATIIKNWMRTLPAL